MVYTFEKLKVFKESHELTLKVYKITKGFPEDEKFGLISQLKRSSASISANIVEGNSRGHKKEFLQFLYLSKGSLEETKYHLLLAKDLNYISADDYKMIHVQAEEVGKLLTGLINYCKKSIKG